MNIFFCAKYKNAQKLSSHNWFFNGFYKELNPKYSILLDVGLRPDAQAICKMYLCLKNHEDVGGVCGYMGLKIQKGQPQNTDFVTSFFHYFADIQRAQQMEYHFSHIIDKPFQSWFNFIHVLPGAFSGYNMKAIWKQGSDKLLQEYFKSINDKINETESNNDTNLEGFQIISRVILPNFVHQWMYPINQNSYEQLMYDQNVYLAEDRILCMGIHKNGYKLLFLPDASAEVDPIKSLSALLGQRKRWINVSFFAFAKVKNSLNQSACQEDFGLKFQILYLSLMNTLGYFSASLFLYTIYIAMEAFKDIILVQILSQFINSDSQIYAVFVSSVNYTYVLMIGGLVFFSTNLTNRNKQFVGFVYKVSTALGIFSFIIFVILLIDVAKGLSSNKQFLQFSSKQTNSFSKAYMISLLRFTIIGIMGLYIFPVVHCSIAFKKVNILFQVIIGAASFIFYTPTYILILNIYALCRMNDLSWGTKGLESNQNSANHQVQQLWNIFKLFHVAKFVVCNVIVSGLLLHFGSNSNIKFWITFVIVILIALTLLIKVGFSILYYIQYIFLINTYQLEKLQENQELETLYKRFLKVKHHFQDSIKHNILNEAYNLRTSHLNLDLSVRNLILNGASRYVQRQKIQNCQFYSHKRYNIFASPINKINFSNSREILLKTISVFKIESNQRSMSLNSDQMNNDYIQPVSKVKILLKGNQEQQST